MPNPEPEATTPDGISREDWAKVHQCAVDIANAADDDAASQESTRELLHVLEVLERRYGTLPSILATRADYTEDVSSRLTLYQAAYEAASARGDHRNLVWIASSLAQLHVDELREFVTGAEWVDRLARHLSDYEDHEEHRELVRLRASVQGRGCGRD